MLPRRGRRRERTDRLLERVDLGGGALECRSLPERAGRAQGRGPPSERRGGRSAPVERSGAVEQRAQRDPAGRRGTWTRRPLGRATTEAASRRGKHQHRADGRRIGDRGLARQMGSPK
jgi:hypothetical protein